MPDQIEQFIKTSDNATDYADNLIVKLEQSATEDIDGLMTGTADRDDDLWSDLGVDPLLTLDDYGLEPVIDRELNWVEGLAGLSAAATTQFVLDNRDETIIKPVAYREQVLSGFALTRVQLVQAGKRSVTVVSEARFVTLQAKYLNELSFMTELTSVELHATLVEYGAMRPFDHIITDSMQYVSRMTSYPPQSLQFKEAVNDLISANSRRGIKGMNRRAVERLYSFRDADGDLRSLMVWIVEGGKNTCDYCLDRAGEILTYGQWIEEGLPGAEVCKGGDLCRCHLAAA